MVETRMRCFDHVMRRDEKFTTENAGHPRREKRQRKTSSHVVDNRYKGSRTATAARTDYPGQSALAPQNEEGRPQVKGEGKEEEYIFMLF